MLYINVGWYLLMRGRNKVASHVILIYSLLFYIANIAYSNLIFADEFQEIHKSTSRIDYKIHANDVEVLVNQQVLIPAKLLQIWQTLTETLNFEVGGGIDFDFLRQVERIKISYGEDKAVAFLPDFEIGWHTHPVGNSQGQLKSLKPPSVEDIIIAIAGNYNLWLISTAKLHKDFSNSLILRAYSEQVERLYAVEVNFVTDQDGIYMYRADQQYWLNFWADKQILQKKLLELKQNLSLDIHKYLIEFAENKFTVNEAREKLLALYKTKAGVAITFFPWQDAINNGILVHLDIIELLQHKRNK